jgi:hypothetical protein
MAVTYAYPTTTPELQDLLIGTEMAVQGGEDTPRTRTFTIQSIRDLVQKTVTNSTQATAFTSTTLNSTYPTATIGFTVQCTNAAVLKSYQKTATGWISYTIANVA